jgi:hypothetical protein
MMLHGAGTASGNREQESPMKERNEVVLKKPIKRKAYHGEYNLVAAIPKESLVDMLKRCKNMANELMTLIDQLEEVADVMLPMKTPKSVKG